MTLPDTWDPALYERFKVARDEPFHVLRSLLQPRPGMKVVDLGCGTGELTRVLHLALGAEATRGLDRSVAMLEKAKTFSAPGLTFEQRAIEALDGEGYDLVFSNAALQWVSDHRGALALFHRVLAPGGQLAVQLPANQDFPTHTVAAELAQELPFRAALLGPPPQAGVLTPVEYAEALHQVGFTAQHVRLQVFTSLLPSREDVVEWVRGSLLTDYQQRLPPPLYQAFLDRYRERLLPRLAAQRPYLFPYKRILFWAQKA